MPVIIEYRGKWLEWCIVTVEDALMLDRFSSHSQALEFAERLGWDVLV